MDKKYTVDEVAEKLRVSPRTILREIKRRRLKVEKVGRRHLISEKFLNTYLSLETSDNQQRNIKNFIDSKKGEMITILQKMVSTSSDSNELGQEERLANLIKDLLEKNEIRTVLYHDGDAVAVRGSFGYASEGIMLDCPLDTTPTGDVDKWKHPPFEGVIKAGRMYGRGTADCKAGIVAMIYAMIALRKFVDEEKVRVELVFDGGEQDGSYEGLRLVIKRGLPVKSAIIGYAGTGHNIGIGCRGYHRFKLTSTGHSVHTGARFEAGVNAITNMAALITDMEHVKFPRPKNKYFQFGSKLNFSKIEGGYAINIIPDECVALLDVRTTPQVKKADVVGILKKVIKSTQLRYKGFDIKYKYLVGQEGYVLQENEKVITKLNMSIKEITKRKAGLVVYGPSNIGTLLYENDIPAIVWGPTGGGVHSYDEYVEIASVPTASCVYANAVLKYFGIE